MNSSVYKSLQTPWPARDLRILLWRCLQSWAVSQQANRPVSHAASQGMQGLRREKPGPPGAAAGAEPLGSPGVARRVQGWPRCAHRFLPRDAVSWWRGCGWAQSYQLTFRCCSLLGHACQLFLWITRARRTHTHFDNGSPPFWRNPISPQNWGATCKSTKCMCLLLAWRSSLTSFLDTLTPGLC